MISKYAYRYRALSSRLDRYEVLADDGLMWSTIGVIHRVGSPMSPKWAARHYDVVYRRAGEYAGEYSTREEAARALDRGVVVEAPPIPPARLDPPTRRQWVDPAPRPTYEIDRDARR
jgi:hypothetical protein